MYYVSFQCTKCVPYTEQVGSALKNLIHIQEVPDLNLRDAFLIFPFYYTNIFFYSILNYLCS